MNQKSKHIVVITPGFPADEQDTACIPALHVFALALAQVPNINLTILPLHYPKAKYNYKWNEIQVHTLGGSTKIMKPFLWRRAMRKFNVINSEMPVDIIHSFWLGECSFIGNRLATRYKIGHVTTVMGQDALPRNIYAKLLASTKMRLVCVSEFQRGIFKINYGIDADVIPWGIAAGRAKSDKTIDIIGVGSLTKLKNFSLFVDVIQKIRETRKIGVAIVGSGPEEEILRRQIKRLGLEDTIKLKGRLSHEQTLEAISRARILLHTSRYESFGMIFPEALQSETKVVSFKTGCYFPSANWKTAESVEDFAEKCIALLESGFAPAENPFRIEKTVKQYLELYDR